MKHIMVMLAVNDHRNGNHQGVFVMKALKRWWFVGRLRIKTEWQLLKHRLGWAK